MPKRPKEEQNVHDQQIVQLTEALDYDEKYSAVHTDNIEDDYPTPDIINMRRPDLVAKFKGRYVIIEIETKSSINHYHTEDQWKAFDKAVEEDESRYAGFVVVVPKSELEDAKKRAKELDVDPEFWSLDY